MRSERNWTGLSLRQRDGGDEDPIGIEATPEDPEPSGVAAMGLRHLFAIIRAEQVGIATERISARPSGDRDGRAAKPIHECYRRQPRLHKGFS